MKAISIFNNKGGVGKTTLMCNLAGFLSVKHNKKVAIVDADPQCNSTIYLLDPKTVDKLYQLSSKENTIYELLKPLSKGHGYTKELPLLRSDRFQVDVIPGDPRLSLMEDLLSIDWKDTTNGIGRGIQTSLLFYDVVMRLKEKHYDYLFFDVGPSLGALNRAVLLATDNIIIPVSADIFSLRAIENIGISLKNWINGFNDGIQKYEKNENEKYMLYEKTVKINPRYSGYIVQQYATKTIQGNRTPVKAFDMYIKKIPTIIDKALGEYATTKAGKLGEVPTLQSVIPLSQMAHAPIFELKSKDGILGNHFNAVKEYTIIMEHICDNFEKAIK